LNIIKKNVRNVKGKEREMTNKLNIKKVSQQDKIIIKTEMRKQRNMKIKSRVNV
jgi:hypothetical protein